MPLPVDIAHEVSQLRERLATLERESAAIATRLAMLEQMFAVPSLPRPLEAAADRSHDAPSSTASTPVATDITNLAVFRNLFHGREDVFPRRWENATTGKAGYAPACRNEWVRGVCGKPAVKCGECPNQAFIPVTDAVLQRHITGQAPGKSGDFTMGVYPLLPDETCWFLAADFGKASWQRDVAAYRDTARERGVTVAVERSRSGNGAHAWIFFAEPVPAADAGRLGALLLTATMERCPDIGFDSYDRFFPSQDTLPAGGFGNLIALPLQGRSQERGNSVTPAVRDERQHGTPLGVQFLGELTPEQHEAATCLLAHDTGILAASTAFGKTVVAAHLIAARDRNTLVLVHRRQLLDQWVARLQTFLDIPPAQIGVLYGGKKKPGGRLDVALMQSVVRHGEVADLVAAYGHVVVDECHHRSAVSFEAISRAAKARFVLGLSATVTRKDGHHPIIFMQCGPVRYKVDDRRQAAARPFAHQVIVRRTAFQATRRSPEERPTIQALYAALAADERRNELILSDILAALSAGRSPVVISERKEHVAHLADRLATQVPNVIVLQGGMGARQRRVAAEALEAIPADEPRVLVATGRYLGEGFDDARLDTLFLTLPISWRGTLAQYAGRLHRLYAAKRAVLIYDYVDGNEPLLAKMAARRDAGYRSLGYETSDEATRDHRVWSHKGPMAQQLSFR
ncbi:MAG TPA: DEAD/DEAH box helicase family protein [Chloroflexota bacterium]|nr:DEAD/DEAH box helicase family protein [Chloroflexota bacterium]